MKKTAKTKTKPFVVVRTYASGVHVGTLETEPDRLATLTNARRLHRWRGANTLHEVSLRGVDEIFSRISEPVALIYLTDALEFIPTTPEAEANLTRSRWCA